MADQLKIGNLDIYPPVVLAPMAGVTNLPFRELCRRFGAGLYVSEMLGARAIVEEDERTLHLATFGPNETTRSMQLYATDAAAAGGAVERLIDLKGVHHVDFNFGCPAPKVTRHGGGAVLPYRHRLYGEIVSAAVKAAGTVPVTVKFRMGIDDDHLTFIQAGRIAEDAGASAVALHARTAEQLYSGHARWEAIGELKQAITTIPVLGNGDVFECADAHKMMAETGCDGVVVGRGCLGRPWLFRELAEGFAGLPMTAPPTLGEVVDIMVEHAQLLIDWFDEHRGIRSFRKHTSWYLKGYTVGKDIRTGLHSIETVADVRAMFDGVDLSQPFPSEAAAMPRGHTHGPRPVKVPYGYLDDPEAMGPLNAAASVAVSGG